MNATAAVLVTADDLLASEVLRLAGAAGADLVIEREPAAAVRSWARATAVLVGADLAAGCAELVPPRRAAVWVVARRADEGTYREAIACGAAAVLLVPAQDAEVIELLADLSEAPHAGNVVVGVIGGAGGVGASTFACALARACSTRAATVVLDVDHAGSGIDRIAGIDRTTPGIRWDALLHSTGRLPGHALREALPVRDGLAVLAWPAERGTAPELPAVRDVLDAAARGFSTTVIDLPRLGVDWVPDLVSRCDRILLVSTTTVPALAAAARLVPLLPAPDVGLILRRRTGGVGTEDVGRFLSLPVVAAMGGQRGLDEDIALGLGPTRRRRGPLARAAGRAARHVLGA